MAKASYLYFNAFLAVSISTSGVDCIVTRVHPLARLESTGSDPVPGDTADLNDTDSLTKQAIGAID